MKRLTVSLPDDLAAALHQESERRNVPETTFVQELISNAVRPRPGFDISAFIGMVSSGGVGPFARDHEAVLEESWLDRIENDRDGGAPTGEHRDGSSRRSA